MFLGTAVKPGSEAVDELLDKLEPAGRKVQVAHDLAINAIEHGGSSLRNPESGRHPREGATPPRSRPPARADRYFAAYDALATTIS